MSSSTPSMNSSAPSLTIRASKSSSLGGLPLHVVGSSSASSASPAPVFAPQSTPAPAPAPGLTSFVLSSSRSSSLRLLSPEAIARHALGSPMVPVRGPPRLAAGFIPFPAPAPSPADDPRVVFANTTPDTHRTQSHSSGPGYSHTYGSGYVAHSNGAGPGPSTAAAWRDAGGAARLSTIQEGSSHRSFSPPSSAAPPSLSISRESSRATSDGGASIASASTSPISAVSEFSGSKTDINIGATTNIKSIRVRQAQRALTSPRTRGKSVDATLSFADFKAWNVRSEDFGQSRKEARKTCVDGASSTTGSGSSGPQPELVRHREEEDDFGRELDELESVVSDVSEKLATLHFVGREDLLSPEASGSGEAREKDKGKENARGDVRKGRREARRVLEMEKAPITSNKSPSRSSLSRRTSWSSESAASAGGFRPGPPPPLVFSAS